MKIFVNRKIKLSFFMSVLSVIIFSLLSVLLICLNVEYAAIYVLAFSMCMGISILAIWYWYFNDQNKIMEDAVTQIKEYISGNENARIECNDEGELYRLFHEVNALAAVLHAHADKEKATKKFLKNIISDISHQLKTPLAALNIYNGILQEESQEYPTIKEFVDFSEQELDRIETLVQNLLKIAKLDSGTIMLEKDVENVSEMMKKIESHFSYRADQEEKNFSLSGDDTVTLLCDHTWMMEAVSNIIKNAFDHTEKGNTISVKWKQSASVVQIVVRDNGSGIHPEDLHYIFKRFYRSRFSKDTKGIGLGLSLTKAIVEAHSGTIGVESELGFGTTFTLSFLIPTKL